MFISFSHYIGPINIFRRIYIIIQSDTVRRISLLYNIVYIEYCEFITDLFDYYYHITIWSIGFYELCGLFIDCGSLWELFILKALAQRQISRISLNISKFVWGLGHVACTLDNRLPVYRASDIIRPLTSSMIEDGYICVMNKSFNAIRRMLW